MKIKHVLAGAGLALALSQSVSAVTLNSTYTGATPLNTLSYQFNNATKILLLSMTGPDTTEFVTAWGFDIVGNTSGWGVKSSSGVATPGLSVPGAPSLNPRNFDFSFGFQKSAGPGRFNSGDSIEILLPNVTSVLTSGAHMQGISASPGSGKVTVGVPEPASILSGLTALGMLALARKRFA